MAPISSFEPKLHQFEKQAKNLIVESNVVMNLPTFTVLHHRKSYNIHELMADTAFRILAIVLGEDEEYVAKFRRVRWAFHKATRLIRKPMPLQTNGSIG